ncbi:MAG: hypothetical protein JW741_09445 [Sedimentisphaerales bacterium]|nr:hypothetical protein [Sedimentisphaerales bacterium]
MMGTKKDNAVYAQPAFVICVAVLALAGVGMSVAKRQLGVYLKKEPLPLQKALDELDEARLAPYVVTDRREISNAEILKALGTTDYIQWVVTDPCAPANSPVRSVLLFVTYYELPDRVPHVPEECYTGGGYQRLATDAVTFAVGPAGRTRTIGGRFLLFGAAGGSIWDVANRFPVLYLFCVNGTYAASRDEARIALNRNIFGKYSYFSKIELVFNQGFAAPTREEAVAACERLLAAILPVLEQEHWPQWSGREGASE